MTGAVFSAGAAGTATSAPDQPSLELMAHHGDRDARAGLVDLSVNVRADAPPAWLREHLSAVDLRGYPDDTAARTAVAQRHARTPDEVVITAGAAEAFTLIARTFAPRRAVIVHPQFTEPELALRRAGHQVERVVLAPPFRLDAAAVPPDADLVMVGNPTNPTSVLHPADELRRLARPGRILVVDEAFADTVPDEPQSLAGCAEVPGLIVVRSLTKTWGLAGLRAGYLLAERRVADALTAVQPPWPVSAPALEACRICSAPAAIAEARRWALELAQQRAALTDALGELPEVSVVPAAAASFVLLRLPFADGPARLRERGFAVRRGDTFPGLGTDWIRVAVRDERVMLDFVHTLKEIL